MALLSICVWNDLDIAGNILLIMWILWIEMDN